MILTLSIESKTSMKTGKTYSDHDDNIEVETVNIDGQNVTVITIKADIIELWYEEGLDQVVLHVEDEQNSKFF